LITITMTSFEASLVLTPCNLASARQHRPPGWAAAERSIRVEMMHTYSPHDQNQMAIRQYRLIMPVGTHHPYPNPYPHNLGRVWVKINYPFYFEHGDGMGRNNFNKESRMTDAEAGAAPLIEKMGRVIPCYWRAAFSDRLCT
jgi:hypothetical protein